MKKAWLALALVGLLVGCDSDSGEEGGVATPWALDQASDSWWMSTVNVGDQRWIVGGSPAEGKMLHDDGSGFKEVNLGVEVELLNWVHHFADGTFATVGYSGAVLSSANGTSWSLHESKTDQDLWGVWGATPDDVWAVGGNGMQEGDAVIFRGPIGDLQPVAIPELQRPNVNAWYKVWGSGPDDVFIVGQKGALLHWNGTELEEQLVGLSDDLIGIWGTGPDRVAVVGGRGNGVMALWDGAEWRGIDLAPLTGLNGVWMRGNILHAVGVFSTAVKIDFTTGEVLGEEEYLEENFPEASNVDLHAIHGSEDGKVTAIGGNYILQAGPYSGVVVSRGLGSDE